MNVVAVQPLVAAEAAAYGSSFYFYVVAAWAAATMNAVADAILDANVTKELAVSKHNLNTPKNHLSF